MASSHSAVIHLAKSIVSSKTSKSELSSLLSQLTKTIRSSANNTTVPRVPPTSSMQPTSPLQSFEMLAAPKKQQRHESSPDNNHKPGLTQANATYGETPPDTIRDLTDVLLGHYNNGADVFGGDFVDIGSGNGIATTAAAMTGKWRACHGIEYETDRHDTALLWKSDYDNSQDKSGGSTSTSTPLEFTCGDMLQYPHFAGASVVFANSPTWDAALVGSIGTVLDEQLADNALVVSISRRFPSPSFDLVDLLKMDCNNGDFTFYICQKTQADGHDGEEKELSLAMSDSTCIRSLRQAEGGALFMEVIRSCLSHDGNEGMSLLAALGTSETTSRLLATHSELLSVLSDRLCLDQELPIRAGSSMVFRELVNFPSGRRGIAESDACVSAFMTALQESSTSIHKNDHPMVQANLLDIAGQLLYDPVGNEILVKHDIDSLLATTIGRQEHDSIFEACHQAQFLRRWWQGSNILVPP